MKKRKQVKIERRKKKKEKDKKGKKRKNAQDKNPQKRHRCLGPPALSNDDVFEGFRLGHFSIFCNFRPFPSFFFPLNLYLLPFFPLSFPRFLILFFSHPLGPPALSNDGVFEGFRLWHFSSFCPFRHFPSFFSPLNFDLLPFFPLSFPRFLILFFSHPLGPPALSNDGVFEGFRLWHFSIFCPFRHFPSFFSPLNFDLLPFFHAFPDFFCRFYSFPFPFPSFPWFSSFPL